MATAKPRNRVVVFRVTEDEYDTLKDACRTAGARNLSDFTRSELLTHLHLDPATVRFVAIEDTLQRLLETQHQIRTLVASLSNGSNG